ncbi:MAG TPA: agmatinase [Candidatus Bathyarchaeia archaeon]|nr:agmatinase [Candidatus Bathyarchaeia archaeon]
MNSTSNPLQPFFGATTDNINYANICTLGIPWDKSSSFRYGAIQGPEYIRHATSGKLYNPYSETGKNLCDIWQIFDIGDAPLENSSEMEAKAKIEALISRHNKYDMRFFFLGGDHLTTYFTFTALKKIKDLRMGLIYIDAHPDLYEHYEGNPFSHACVVKRIIDDTNIEPESIFQVGIRATTPEQQEYANSIGIKTITTKDIHQKGSTSIADTIKQSLPKYLNGVYLSVDLDVLDPAYAPGVGNPEPGGLNTRELIEFIQGLQGIKLQGFDIVELNPKFDFSGISAFAAAKLVKELLGIM